MSEAPEILDKITDIVLAYRPKSKRKKPCGAKERPAGGKILMKVKRAKREDQIAVLGWLKKRLGP